MNYSKTILKYWTMKNYLLGSLFCFVLTLPLISCSKNEISGDQNSDNNVLKSGPLVGATLKTITFSGYTWYVKSGNGMGPGPNNWNANNVFVDALGKLHLQIKYSSTTKKWECAEVWTTTNLGFGKYEWCVEGRIDLLDKNVVVGLFNYPTASIGPDGTNEIDIEFSKWGNKNNKMGNFTVWPAQTGYAYSTFPYAISLTGTYTTHRFSWSSTGIFFQSLNGWRTDDTNVIATQNFAPVASPTSLIPQSAEPVHINLWLFKGNAPSNNTSVEVIISKFQKY